MATANFPFPTSAQNQIYQPDLKLVVVASGTTAMLTYYNGIKAPTGTGTDVQTPNKAIGDIVFSTVSTTDTISVTGSTDGTNYDSKLNATAGAELVIFNLATGLPHTTGDLATGTYMIPYRYHQQWQTLQFLKSGTNAVASLAVAKVVRIP
jgi:hypothetical protein